MKHSTASSLLAIALALACVWEAGASLNGSASVTSVRGVFGLMYRVQAGVGGCYKLLNATAEIGCEGPTDAVDAPLVRLDDLAQLPDGDADAVVLVPAARQDAYLAELAAAPDAVRRRVRGVLVDDTDVPGAMSSLPPFPGAAYAPAAQRGYAWNPGGSGAALERRVVPALPVLALGARMAADARERAAFNLAKGMRGRQYRARARLPMSASGNASACLAARTCKPLGSHSVWAAAPPLPAANDSSAPPQMPAVAVVAQADAADVFHDLIQGADAPLSGLIAMLAAAHALQAFRLRSSSFTPYPKRLVFVALAGDPWDAMGSRRLLWELERGAPSIAGLDWRSVEQIVEVGSVGKGSSSGTSSRPRLYAHRQRDDAAADASDVVAALVDAGADGAAGGAADVAPATRAPAAGGGLPPSSLLALLAANASVKGALLTDFDAAITDANPLYGSRFDDASNVDAASITAAALALAGALHRLAGGDAAAWRANATEARAVVDTLLGCLVARDPGLACPAATALIVPSYSLSAGGERSYAARHYVGVLQSLHPDGQSPFLKQDVPRLVWNLLALYTAADQQDEEEAAPCDYDKRRCAAPGDVCVGWRGGRGRGDDGLGRCVAATVRYVPSLSTRIECAGCDDYAGPGFQWVESGASDAWAARLGLPRDAMWVESDWPYGVPRAELFLLAPPEAERAVLVAGCLVTAAAAVAAHFVRAAFSSVGRFRS